MDELTNLKQQKLELEEKIHEKMRTAFQIVRELEEDKLQQQVLHKKILSTTVNHIASSEGLIPKRFWN
jgi:hypothetical protein